ncbi:MAG: hypothetical protein AB1414_05730 [bacterium]
MAENSQMNTSIHYTLYLYLSQGFLFVFQLPGDRSGGNLPQRRRGTEKT